LTKAEHRRWLENIPEPAIGTNDAVIRVSYTGSARVKGVVLTNGQARRFSSPIYRFEHG
jgi:hypothetical protein